MDKLKEKLSRLMYGRYGIDQLGNFMMWAAVAMMIFGAVVRSSLIYTLALVLIVWADVRIMSKNHSKRYAENQKFPEPIVTPTTKAEMGLHDEIGRAHV